jgi:hypothetical protein
MAGEEVWVPPRPFGTQFRPGHAAEKTTTPAITHRGAMKISTEDGIMRQV